MDCNHKNLRTVGDRLFCKDCGKELPLEYLVNGTKQAEKPAEEAKPEKVHPERERRKRPFKGGKTG